MLGGSQFGNRCSKSSVRPCGCYVGLHMYSHGEPDMGHMSIKGFGNQTGSEETYRKVEEKIIDVEEELVVNCLIGGV